MSSDAGDKGTSPDWLCWARQSSLYLACVRLASWPVRARLPINTHAGGVKNRAVQPPKDSWTG